jgi:hypothetical protein
MNAVRTPLDGARGALRLGDLRRARSLLRVAAGACRTGGDPVEEARCWRLAAAIGRHAAASERQRGGPGAGVASGEERSDGGGAAPERSWGPRERSERQRYCPGSVDALEAALERVPADAPHDRGRLECSYATALLAAGRPDEAAAALCRAADGYADAAGPAVSVRLLIDGVAILQLAGYPAAAEVPARTAEAAVAETDDHGAVCELALLAAERAVAAGDHAAARRHAQRALLEAQAGRAPGGFEAAAVTHAELAEAAGDRVGAYASLVTAWLTLRDLSGAGPARAAFEPRLTAARDRWGTDGYAAVRASYAGRRPRGGNPWSAHPVEISTSNVLDHVDISTRCVLSSAPEEPPPPPASVRDTGPP